MTALDENKPDSLHNFSRRSLLKAGGALVVLVAIPPIGTGRASAAELGVGTGAADETTTGFSDPTLLQSWIAVQADNTVLVRTGKLEMGVGMWTGLMQMVAEELDVPFDSVELIMGDTDKTPDGGYTAGGTLAVQFKEGLRYVAAYARQGLLNLASEHFGVPAAQLSVSDGRITGPSGSVTYADLVSGQVLSVTMPVTGTAGEFFGATVGGSPTLKDPTTYKIVGKPIQRVDLPPKITGTYNYLQDVRLPGMLHARMVRPATMGSKLVKVKGFGKKRFPGTRVIVKGNLVGVVSSNEWEAIEAANALQVEWTHWSGLPGSDHLAAAMRSSPNPLIGTDILIGDAASALGEPPPPPLPTAAGGATAARASGPIKATYEMPVVYHGPIGPYTSVADVASDGQIVVYSCTSIPQILRESVAAMMSTSPDNVTVLHREYSSQYGRTSLGTDDPAADAVLLSAAVGKPVRVVWDREDDHMWSPKVQPALNDMAATLSDGSIQAWSHVNFQSAWDSRMLGAILAGSPGAATGPPPGGGWAAIWIYDKIPNVLIESHGIKDFGQPAPNGVGMRFTIMRSPGNLQSVFGMEGFMNELAVAAKADPIDFRLKHTSDPRAIAVLKELKAMMKWDTRSSPSRDASAKGDKWVTGRGMALAERNDGASAYVAAAAEMKVKPSTGEVRVTRFWVADDSGLVVNPVGLGKVIQSGVIQGTSLALKEEVTFDHSKVTSQDWDSYPILTMAESPEISWKFVGNEPGNPVQPAGEPIANVVQPAIVAAFQDATGKFIRRVPLTPKYVKQALKA